MSDASVAHGSNCRALNVGEGAAWAAPSRARAARLRPPAISVSIRKYRKSPDCPPAVRRKPGLLPTRVCRSTRMRLKEWHHEISRQRRLSAIFRCVTVLWRMLDQYRYPAAIFLHELSRDRRPYVRTLAEQHDRPRELARLGATQRCDCRDPSRPRSRPELSGRNDCPFPRPPSPDWQGWARSPANHRSRRFGIAELAQLEHKAVDSHCLTRAGRFSTASLDMCCPKPFHWTW